MSGILGYARVSTGDQDVAGQTMRLEQAGAIKVFTDVRSGKSLDRPGLTDLLSYARAGDTLAVVRLDRLGRSLGELLTVVKELKERGVALLSLEEKIDTSSAAGELVFHVFGAIAHFERRLIAARTKDGIAAARAKGKLPGLRPLDPDKASAALKLVEAGVSPTDAVRQLGLGRATVFERWPLLAFGGRLKAAERWFLLTARARNLPIPSAQWTVRVSKGNKLALRTFIYLPQAAAVWRPRGSFT